MRIGIDARLAGSQHAGIGRYIEELVRSLAAQSSPHTWVVFLAKKDQLPWLSSHPEIKQVIAPVRHYTLSEQVMMPVVFYKEKLDLLHVPHFNVPVLYRKPYVVTIHDLLWHEKKERTATTLSPVQHALKYRAYRYVAEQAIGRACHVIVPSKVVQEAVLPFVSNKDKVSVIKEGVSLVYQTDKKLTALPVFSHPYIVYTGSLYPHKNVPFILDALLSLPAMHFFIVGSRSVFQERFKQEIAQRGLLERVHLLGYLEDEKLKLLYKDAIALVQPSLSEGFGLTGVEAMACGTPVLASDIPVLREVYSDAALFFDPHNISSLQTAIGKIQKQGTLRKTLIAKGYRVATQYDWKHAAKETMKVYQSCFEQTHKNV